MDTLFDFAGIDLPKSNLVVSEAVLKDLARKASQRFCDSNNNKFNDELYIHIYDVLQEHFSSKDQPSISSSTLESNSITAIANYLVMQDILECRSMKEIYSLSSGLYDSVISYIAALARSTALKEVELNITPQPISIYSNNNIFEMQAAE